MSRDAPVRSMRIVFLNIFGIPFRKINKINRKHKYYNFSPIREQKNPNPNSAPALAAHTSWPAGAEMCATYLWIAMIVLKPNLTIKILKKRFLTEIHWNYETLISAQNTDISTGGQISDTVPGLSTRNMDNLRLSVVRYSQRRHCAKHQSKIPISSWNTEVQYTVNSQPWRASIVLYLHARKIARTLS